VKTKELCFLIYNLGQLAEYSRNEIESFVINDIFSELRYAKSLDDKQIGNCFSGLGKLATYQKLKGTLSIENIDNLTNRLQSLNSSTLAIANAIHGLGKLAEKTSILLPLQYSPVISRLVESLDVLFSKRRPY
jgi:hypothetical protein